MQNPGRKCHDLKACIRLATAGCDSVLELGCGFGERLALVDAGLRIGVDAHEPYIEEARRLYPDISFECDNALSHVEGLMFDGRNFDGVLVVDFLEHLPAREARWFVRICQAITNKIIVLYVPLGSHPQNTDPYEMGADHWQTHRSTWEAADLEAMGFDVEVWTTHPNRPVEPRAAFCIWNHEPLEPGILGQGSTAKSV